MLVQRVHPASLSACRRAARMCATA
jgi:hypothetical protein